MCSGFLISLQMLVVQVCAFVDIQLSKAEARFLVRHIHIIGHTKGELNNCSIRWRLTDVESRDKPWIKYLVR
jgi:hypothetical protein